MKPAKTHINWLATLLQPQKSGSNCLYKIQWGTTREIHGETFSNYWSWDKGMVWYGMVVYQKDCKICEGSPLSALHAYNQIISLWFSYYFPSCSMLFPIIFQISLFFPYGSLLFLLFTYYFPLSSLFLPYYFPIYNFLMLPCYCPICLPGFQNDKLRHLEWLCFGCHAKCLKPVKIHIIWFPTKILDFTAFWWHFPKKRLSKPKNDDPFRLFSLFLFIHLLPFRRSC